MKTFTSKKILTLVLASTILTTPSAFSMQWLGLGKQQPVDIESLKTNIIKATNASDFIANILEFAGTNMFPSDKEDVILNKWAELCTDDVQQNQKMLNAIKTLCEKAKATDTELYIFAELVNSQQYLLSKLSLAKIIEQLQDRIIAPLQNLQQQEAKANYAKIIYFTLIKPLWERDLREGHLWYAKNKDAMLNLLIKAQTILNMLSQATKASLGQDSVERKVLGLENLEEKKQQTTDKVFLSLNALVTELTTPQQPATGDSTTTPEPTTQPTAPATPAKDLTHEQQEHKQAADQFKTQLEKAFGEDFGNAISTLYQENNRNDKFLYYVSRLPGYTSLETINPTLNDIINHIKEEINETIKESAAIVIYYTFVTTFVTTLNADKQWKNEKDVSAALYKLLTHLQQILNMLPAKIKDSLEPNTPRQIIPNLTFSEELGNCIGTQKFNTLNQVIAAVEIENINAKLKTLINSADKQITLNKFLWILTSCEQIIDGNVHAFAPLLNAEDGLIAQIKTISDQVKDHYEPADVQLKYVIATTSKKLKDKYKKLNIQLDVSFKQQPENMTIYGQQLKNESDYLFSLQKTQIATQTFASYLKNLNLLLETAINMASYDNAFHELQNKARQFAGKVEEEYMQEIRTLAEAVKAKLPANLWPLIDANIAQLASTS